MSELISVIMPAYNVGTYIGKSIESVLQQTYQNIEFIIVNDGSTDNTKDVIAYYQQKDSRIVYIEQANQGVSAARNAGIKAANGKYISFLDGDDLWLDTALEKMYAKMVNTSDCHFVYARTEEYFLSGEKQLIGPADTIDGYLESFIHKTNELRLRMHIICVLLDKDMLLEHKIFFPVGIKISEDTAFLIEALAAAKAYGIDDIAAYYMRRENSATTHIWRPEAWQGQIVIYELILPFIRKMRPEALKAFFCMRNYVAYRFVLHCIRDGFWQEAEECLGKWHDYLIEFAAGNGKPTDRLKCRAILAVRQSRVLLKIIGKF